MLEPVTVICGALIWAVAGMTAPFIPGASAAPPVPEASAPRQRPLRVVLDPGHGGSDRGARHPLPGGYEISESDLTLLLGRRVSQALARLGHRVTLTRTDDREVPLADRTRLANRLRADVFVSLHMNSSPGQASATASGFETYILDNASDAGSRRLAHLENSILARQAHAGAQGALADPAPDVALILKDLRLDANVAESKRLACLIQGALVNAGRSAGADRGVKQALFHVLLGADMPSVLVEAGFIGNDRDRSLVIDPKSQARMAASIARAIDRFGATRGTREATQQLASCPVR